jgi:hypothetical protein
MYMCKFNPKIDQYVDESIPKTIQIQDQLHNPNPITCELPSDFVSFRLTFII